MERKRKRRHPGVIIQHLIFDEKGISLNDAAELLGTTRIAVSNLAKGKVDISTDMALRIAKVFGGNANYWLRMQIACHFDEASPRICKLKLKRHKPKIKKAVLVKQTKSVNQTAKKAA